MRCSNEEKKVKIVCTLGPATHTPQMIASLMKEGMDVARLNFSHGDHNFHAGMIQNIRQTAKQVDRNVAIMQDLQGPKIRVGKLPDAGVQINAGDILLLYPEGTTPKTSAKGKKQIPISAEIALPISKDISKDAWVLFDDGQLASRVKSVSPPEIVVEVVEGGLLKSHKGMNLPGTPLSIDCVTEKDLADLKFGLSKGVDAVALSFVRSHEDIEHIQSMIRKTSNHYPLVFAKIERDEAIREHESIVDVSDGILIARGDMATEIGAERVPLVQKQLIRECNEVGVPVITATQMLESMVKSRTPTRAEANDVANAVFDGTDAVMLSGETASGKWPVESVKVMAKIIRSAEKHGGDYSVNPEVMPIPGSIVDSIEFSAARIAQHIGAVAITAFTNSGRAIRTLSKYRPQNSIVAIMDQESDLRKLAFSWGVHGILIDELVATDNFFTAVEEILVDHGWAEKGDLIVITAGVPTMRRGTTNTVKVHKVGAPIERAATV